MARHGRMYPTVRAVDLCLRVSWAWCYRRQGLRTMTGTRPPEIAAWDKTNFVIPARAETSKDNCCLDCLSSVLLGILATVNGWHCWDREEQIRDRLKDTRHSNSQ